MIIEERRRKLRRGTYRGFAFMVTITVIYLVLAQTSEQERQVAPILSMIVWFIYLVWELIRRLIFSVRHMSGEDQAKSAGIFVGVLAIVFAVIKIIGSAQDSRSKTATQSYTSTTNLSSNSKPVQSRPKPTEKSCPTCKGNGQTNVGTKVMCWVCAGAGYSEKEVSSGDSLADMYGHTKTQRVNCTNCRGSGEIIRTKKATCTTCNGRGKVTA